MSDSASIEYGPVRTARQDEHHNAFTDLCRFRDRYFLAFRSCPEGHQVAIARIVILASDDGNRWDEVYSFDVPHRDPRDPHFLVFKDRLFVYTGTWLVRKDEPLDLNEHLGYAVWTDDGEAWEGPTPLEGTYGHYVWRAATHGNLAFLCGRRRHGFEANIESERSPATIEGAMLESEDGLVWRFRAFFDETYGDETAFLFEDDGSVLAIARDGAGERARVCRSSPSLDTWTRAPLDRNVAGPMIERWGDRYLVGGRKYGVDRVPSMMLYWLFDDRLEEVVELPSGGDCSYPGFVAKDETHGLLSYYSSHEGPTSIYVTDVRVV